MSVGPWSSTIAAAPVTLPHKNVGLEQGSVFCIKRDPANVLGSAPPGQLLRRSTVTMKYTSRHLLLAGADGILSSLALVVIERVTNYYADIQRGPTDFILERQPFWTLRPVLFNVAVFFLAAVIVRRFFLRNYHLLFFWLAAALVVITCSGLTWLVAIVVSSIAAGQSLVEKILEALIFSSSQQAALTFAAAVLGVNVIFGAVIQIVANYNR